MVRINFDNVKDEFTKQDYINYLGSPEKDSNNKLYWQCPYCEDSHKDNLIYSKSKNVIHCFADGRHAPQLLKDMWAKNKAKIIKNIKSSKRKAEPKQRKPDITLENIQANTKFCIVHNNLFKTNIYAQNLLLKKRGIEPKTAINYGIGYKPKCEGVWIIPKYQYLTHAIIGAEIRPFEPFLKEDKVIKSWVLSDKLMTNSKSVSDLCQINRYTDKMECLAIVEGFFDGITLYQFLKEKDYVKYYHIVTSSNGIGSLLNQMKRIDFRLYKQIYLYVDNDKEGNKATEQILDKYSQYNIERIKLDCGCKDFNEHYLKCIKNKAIQVDLSGRNNIVGINAPENNFIILKTDCGACYLSNDMNKVIINNVSYAVPDYINKKMLKYNDNKTIEIMLRGICYENKLDYISFKDSCESFFIP